MTRKIWTNVLLSNATLFAVFAAALMVFFSGPSPIQGLVMAIALGAGTLAAAGFAAGLRLSAPLRTA